MRLPTAGTRVTPEKTHAIVVNAHGALILLSIEVKVDQLIVVQNLDTKQELLCRVTSLGESFMGKTQVAVEFIMPAPGFWGAAIAAKDTSKTPA